MIFLGTLYKQWLSMFPSMVPTGAGGFLEIGLGWDCWYSGECGSAGYKEEESFGWWCVKTDDPELFVYHLSSWLLGEGKLSVSTFMATGNASWSISGSSKQDPGGREGIKSQGKQMVVRTRQGNLWVYEELRREWVGWAAPAWLVQDVPGEHEQITTDLEWM